MDAIKNAIKSGHGTGILMAGMLGLVLSDLLPTPADALYFSQQQKNKAKLEKGQISAKQYWYRESVGYYGYNVVWWLLVYGAVASIKGDFKKKAELAVGLIAAGAVVSVIHKNIQKDTEMQKHLSYKR